MSDLVARLVKRLREAKAVMFFDGWTSSILHIEAADLIEQQAAKIAELERTVDFVVRWAWREDPINAARKLSDEERLSAIKFYPDIKARSLKKGEQA